VATGKITFDNILNHMSDVAQTAFDDVHRVLNTNPMPASIASTIWVGPNTTPVGPTTEDVRFSEAMKLWSGFRQPATFGAFFYNTQDEPAAEIAFAKWKADFNINGGPDPSQLANDCRQSNGTPGGYIPGPIGDCTNANGGVIDAVGTGVGLFGVPTAPGPRSDPYRFGALEIHEYTHMVQTAQFIGVGDQPGRAMQSGSPCWLQEGQAHFASKTSASSTLNDYLVQRNGEALSRTDGDGQIPPRDIAGISAYLSLQTLATCSNTYSWGYATGMLAVEALSAIGGVQSTMALYAEEARGNSFVDAFQMVYGISWSSAQPILVQVIANDYQLPSMSVR
jgi:hypothetical protein